MSSFEDDYATWAEMGIHCDEMDARFGWGLRDNEVHHLRKQVEELAAAFTMVWISADRGGWDTKALKHFDDLVELHNALGQEPCADVCARSPAPTCYTAGD